MTQYNADENELNHFASLANQWWDLEGKLKTLHDINPIRIDFIKKHTEINNKLILDVGCGGGILSEGLAACGGYVTGIDLEQNAIDVATNHSLKNNLKINYYCQDLELFVENHQEKFDIITCMELLEHVPRPCEIIQHCKKLLKPNGKLLLSTINRTPKAYLFAIIGAEHLLKIIPKNTHHFDKFIKPSEIERWLHNESLNLTDLVGLNYNPITRKADFTDDVQVNYLIAAEFN